MIFPPDPLLPLPTLRKMEPPRPPVAAPLPMRILPLLPFDVVPELKCKLPDIPAVPPFALFNEIIPLLEELPNPLSI